MSAGHALLGVGGAHVDRIGQIDGDVRAGASNPGTMDEWIGGCMANTLRVARAIGNDQIGLIAARGADAGGQSVAEALTDAGIDDHSAVFLDRATPSYTAILAPDGDVIVALADMTLYETGLARHLRRAEPRALLAAADRVIVDANLPEAAIGHVLGATQAPVLAHAISPAKAPRIAPHARRFALTFMNRREMNALTGRPPNQPIDDAGLQKLRAEGFARAVISDGGAPVTVLDSETVLRQSVPRIKASVDVTGAGDALAGAVAALWPEQPLIEAVRTGIIAAAETIAVRGPVAPELDRHALIEHAAALPPPTETILPQTEATHADHPV